MPKAVLQSLILAEHVYEDRATGKKIVAGIFHRLLRAKQAIKPVTEPVPAPTNLSAPASQASDSPPRSNAPEAQQQQRVIEIPATGLRAGSPFLYLSLTEVHGTCTFLMRFVYLGDGSVLFYSDFKASSPDPLQTVEAVIPLPPLSPSQAGVYALELLQDNEILGSLRILVEDAG